MTHCWNIAYNFIHSWFPTMIATVPKAYVTEVGRKLAGSFHATQACPSSILEAPSQQKGFQFLSKIYVPTDDSAECFLVVYFYTFVISLCSIERHDDRWIWRNLDGSCRGQVEVVSRHLYGGAEENTSEDCRCPPWNSNIAPPGFESQSLPLDQLLRLQNAHSCQHNTSSFDILQFLPVEQAVVGIWQSDAYSYFCAVSLLVGVESSTMKPTSEHFRVWPWTVFPHFTCSKKGNVCTHTDYTVHLVSNNLKRDHLAPANTRFAASYCFSRDLASCSSIILFFLTEKVFYRFSYEL